MWLHIKKIKKKRTPFNKFNWIFHYFYQVYIACFDLTPEVSSYNMEIETQLLFSQVFKLVIEIQLLLKQMLRWLANPKVKKRGGGG